MLLAILIDTKIFLWFRLIYWTSVIIIIYILKNSKINTLNTETKNNVKKWLIIIIIANLAGIPPLRSFLIKWLLIIAILKIPIIIISTGALIIRAINFFIYLRIMRKQILSPTNKIQIENNPIKKLTKIIILTITVTPIMLLIILGNAWNKGL